MAIVERIGDMLVRRKLLPRETVETIARESANNSMRFASLAVDHWHVDERAMLQILAERCGIPAVEVDKVPLQPAAVAKIPLGLARRHSVFPMALQGEQLHVAMADPLDVNVRREVEVGTRCSILPYIGLHERIHARLDDAYQKAAAAAQQAASSALVLPVVTGYMPLPIAMPTSDVVDETSIIGEPTEALVGSREIIVVAHPDTQQRKDIFNALARTGCTILAAADGFTALNLIKEHRPRMVVLSALLPQVEGFEICRKMKSSRRFGAIPVMLIGSPKDSWLPQENSATVEADCLLQAPVSMSEVTKHAGRLLKASPGARSVASTQEQFDSAYFAGVEAMENGDVKTALAAFRRAEVIDPLAAKTHYMLGRALEENSEPLKAIYHFERATMLNPRLFPALKQLAQLYQAHGFRQKANEVWQQAMNAAPTPEVGRQIKIYLEAVNKDDF